MIRREVIVFLIVGSLTVLLDFLTYRALVWYELLEIDFAKGIGFLTGTVFAYFANRLWTFKHNSVAVGAVWRFIVVYLISLSVNIKLNAIILVWLVDTSTSIQVAFLVATGASTILNFLGMKLFVFRAAPHWRLS
jgi:putative flippase GtrA